MGKLIIYREESAAYTALSNLFIDNYMAEANDAQLKVYLHLLRIVQAGRDTSISDMADLFNHTEKDIVRALRYWGKKSLLALEQDASGTVLAIHLLPLDRSGADIPGKADQSGPDTPAPPALSLTAIPADQTPSASLSLMAAPADTALFSGSPTAAATDLPLSQPGSPEHAAQPAPDTAPAKPPAAKTAYTADDLKTFRDNEETAQLLFIVEQYIGKPLSASDVKTVLFIYDSLGFSADLIDYLVQYCVEKEKKSFRYIEKVALEWAENHIATPKEAKNFAYRYEKNVYTVMKALGKNNEPTPKEAAFVTRWTKEWDFPLAVIEAACERTVLAVDRHRFEYAERILSSWHQSQVHSLEDIRAIDEAYQKKKTAMSHSGSAPAYNNQFNQFPQREYDFDALEKELLSN